MLETDGDGTYRFSAYVKGRIEIRLGDHVVLQGERTERGWLIGPSIQLPYDWLDCHIDYHAPAEGAEMRLFWEGPQFTIEPLPSRLFSHPIEETVQDRFAQGRLLARAFHCSACHRLPSETHMLQAPSLEYARYTLKPNWVRERLTEKRPPEAPPGRHMPYYGLSSEDAEDLLAYLWAQSTKPPKVDLNRLPKGTRASSRKKGRKRPSPETQRRQEVATGRRLVLSLGCLACHAVDDFGGAGPLAGPTLDDVFSKRPATWFVEWLADPSAFQPAHRMPVFELTLQEARAIGAWLSDTHGKRDSHKSPSAPPVTTDAARVARGKAKFEQLGCIHCHATSDGPAKPVSRTWATENMSNKSCLADQPDLPFRFALDAQQRQALRAWVSRASESDAHLSGRDVMREHRCLACHRRGSEPGLAEVLTALGEREPKLASRIPAMTPPPLDSVGDKLTDDALRAAIQRKHPTLRTYLDVRMPRFRMEASEIDAIVDYLVSADRIPDGYPANRSSSDMNLDRVTLKTAGARLVTSSGFGCTSCHAVGGVLPPAAPLNARGPELTQPARRIRRSWFERWVRNPSRIVARMEMPGVQVPVRGVLDEDLDRQLAAVWEVLNLPDFKPPAPNPVRTVRQMGMAAGKPTRAVFISDVVRYRDQPWVKPLLIGLANRHNVLFDLAEARQQFWTTGDVAWQRTEGKTWYWELAGTVVAESKGSEPEFELVRGSQRRTPLRSGQFVTEFDEVVHDLERGGLVVRYRLRFQVGPNKIATLRVTQSWHPVRNSGGEGFVRRVQVSGVPAGWDVHFRPWAGVPSVVTEAKGRQFRIPGPARPAARLLAPSSFRATDSGWYVGKEPLVVAYRAQVQVDRFPAHTPEPLELQPLPMRVLPGFRVTRLPFPQEIMPTALAWLPDGRLAYSSLKGRVWLAEDRDGDGLEEATWPASDELAAPYGLHARPDGLDVLNKYALLRLTDVDGDGIFDRYVTLASGWGHTTDYHDWAVGLPRDEKGAYYVALPCQQDERSEAAARYRGKVLRLVPREPTPDDPRRYRIEVISGGHRFPMGIARRRDGELFVTDNQGNYNPFNELNHVLPGARYGFYNALEKKKGLKAPTTPPAIKIPHPWTRSVNGIAFLETPAGLGKPAFGPFEGHLVGCEFNERALVRMTLEKVQGVMQGAVYPFTWPQPLSGPPLIGPVVCAVSPRGELYVGCLRDSGWGGGNNIGSIVQCKPDLDRLPCGIARVRVRPHGFLIEMTRPVDRRRALNPKHFAVSSYTRTSTPAYGGPDQNRRTEPVDSVTLDKSGTRITLKLEQPLRPGYVYEFHLKNLMPHGRGVFFPAEAHYTVHRVPQEQSP